MSTFHVETSADVSAPASAAWRVFGEEFASWSTWAAGITSSSLAGELKPGVVRTNDTTSLGVVTQELTEFDPPRRTLAYAMRSGLPAPLKDVRNRWVIEDRGADGSRLVGRAEFVLAWWAVPLTPLLRKRMTAALQTFAAEFADHVKA